MSDTLLPITSEEDAMSLLPGPQQRCYHLRAAAFTSPELTPTGWQKFTSITLIPESPQAFDALRRLLPQLPLYPCEDSFAFHLALTPHLALAIVCPTHTVPTPSPNVPQQNETLP